VKLRALAKRLRKTFGAGMFIFPLSPTPPLALSLSFAKWILPEKLLDLSSHLHPLADTNLNHQTRRAGLFG
jgi:hypothetical protein